LRFAWVLHDKREPGGSQGADVLDYGKRESGQHEDAAQR